MLLLVLFCFTSSCGLYEPSDARKVSPNVEDRVAKAIEEVGGKAYIIQSDVGTKIV